MIHPVFLRRLGLAALLVIVLFTVFTWVRTGQQDIADVPPRLVPVTETSFAKSYRLVAHTGETIDEKSWPGFYKLIYFGFTYCPAICPTELSKMTAALNVLAEKNAVIQPLFVTVDPERDTRAKLKDYLSLFHPSIVGLTGTPEQVAAALKTFKIYAAKVQDEGMSDYTMDHSSFIYFIAPDGRLLHIFKMEDTAAVIADTVNQWLDQEQLR